jgi:hypothetical protein
MFVELFQHDRDSQTGDCMLLLALLFVPSIFCKSPSHESSEISYYPLPTLEIGFGKALPPNPEVILASLYPLAFPLSL